MNITDVIVGLEAFKMLTRVISGAALILIVGGVLVGGYFCPPILVGFIAVLCAIGCFEILFNTSIIKSKFIAIGASVYGFISVCVRLGKLLYADFNFDTVFVTVPFALFIVICSLVLHSDMSIGAIGSAFAFPVMISYAFSSVVSLYSGKNGVFLLLLLLNFSSICDTGAYFTGVIIGKHKLCPAISPKKTIEGAVGGIIWSMICSVVLWLSFGKDGNIIILLILTFVFCIIGMFGDLFASVIKRSVGIKDYGKLIPGHGGILDRFDSILLIAPLLNLCVVGGII